MVGYLYMDRILLLGASGLVGKALAEELDEKYDLIGTYRNNKACCAKSIYFNVSEVTSIIDILNIIKPLMIVYCLRGDFNCQKDILTALINYLKPLNGKLYFCSTANVFDGDTTKPHLIDDNPIAESDYGKFKIECEKIITKGLGDNSAILRLPMIWGKDSPRLNSLITSLNNNENIDVYTNLYLNNNTDVMLAKQIRYIIDNNLKGVFHLGSTEVINYYELIKKLIWGLGFNYKNFNEKILPQGNHYLAVLPSDNDMPTELSFSNEDLIIYLTT